eukprot:scaffold6243_cov20-Prasinocladus_malaysianus.AAC.1
MATFLFFWWSADVRGLMLGFTHLQLPLLARHGPTVQRDLCYVVRMYTYDNSQTIVLPDELRGSSGALFLVSALHYLFTLEINI